MKDLIYPRYCSISDGTVTVNGKIVFSGEAQTTDEPLLNRIYRAAGLSYPKFFKMDNLSRTGYLAAEYLLRDTPLDTQELKPDTAVVLMNRHASLDTDTTFQKTIANTESYFPSPSLFVYTLPNIVLGEICIRFRISGEGAVFVSSGMDNNLIYHYIAGLFAEGKCNECIFGWVDFYQGKPEAFLAVAEKETFNQLPDKDSFDRFITGVFMSEYR